MPVAPKDVGGGSGNMGQLASGAQHNLHAVESKKKIKRRLRAFLGKRLEEVGEVGETAFMQRPAQRPHAGLKNIPVALTAPGEADLGRSASTRDCKETQTAGYELTIPGHYRDFEAVVHPDGPKMHGCIPDHGAQGQTRWPRVLHP
jgi:hypothetical protein